MIKKEIVVQLRDSSGISPAALIVQKSGEYRSQIYFERGNKRINGKSIMGMMTLPFVRGEAFVLEADGPDEQEAIAGLEEFLTK